VVTMLTVLTASDLEILHVCTIRGNVRFAFALCLSVALLAPIICNGADRKESGGPWIATAAIIRNGEQPGSGVYLKSGLMITAAHRASEGDRHRDMSAL
jgi:hypothetical protein